MKTVKHFITATCLILAGMMNAQIASDPVTGVYKIGGASEIFISYSSGSKISHGVLDVSEDLKNISGVEEPWQTGHLDNRKTASATGDFNGDGADNVVTVTANEEGGIRISIPLIGGDLKNNGAKEYEISLNEQDYTRIRVISGNFVDNPQDEFAICYDLPEGLVIRLFKTDEDLNIEEIASLGGISRFDKNFDIAAGDVDGNGIDEIVMVKNKAKPSWKSQPNANGLIISTYHLYILKYDSFQKELIMHRESEFILQNTATSSSFHSRKELITEMRIACGDMNNDGRDEIAVAWAYYYCYWVEAECINRHWITGNCHEWKYHYHHMSHTFLNTFKLSRESERIENIQHNLGFSVDFGKRDPSDDQHTAITLKCEPMDNLGKARVLFNHEGMVHMFEMGDDLKFKRRTSLFPDGGYLNIQGNETFIVADLNPDTTTLNFNKEVVILRSNRTPAQQLDNRYIGKTSLEIYTMDILNDGTVEFTSSGPAIDFPLSGGQNIALSTFLAGDFDLKDAEVFFVGTPVITRIEDLQQPIVILNSPPVHFDVIGGEVLDLCNAFKVSTPEFIAKYITRVGNKETTTVMVENGFGFSSDTRLYAMAGGNGFEGRVQKNWEEGRSRYNANIQNRTIEEEKSIYTEDFVLYSSLNYDLYKYPVYNRDGRKFGDIAVLNPVSSFSSSWGSANSWTHPSYVFNHEPGNLLSYKQRKNSLDFGTGPGFISHQFSTVTVSPNTDSKFSFTYENLDSADDTYSYSSGTGIGLFTKIGVETTAQLSLSPLGIGGTTSSDIRIGASNDLSVNFHNSGLSTHSTELSSSFRVEGKIGRLVTGFGTDARYKVTPYIYRSQSGALVLDYMVGFDPDQMKWWIDHYSHHPDLAFILPWRYATEKGSENVTVSRKQKTTDIQFYPPIANPGDTVVIIARVHNFSLKKFDDILKVDFYLGDPADGGVKLTDIYGATGRSKRSTMEYWATDAVYDREEYLTFVWKIPDTVSCSPRIYGVIDPENVYTEIHKNNNVGWNLINIYDCGHCEYTERITRTERIPAGQPKFKAYPNPFSSYCQVRFSLPQPEDVQIDLYNLTGHKVAIVTSQWYDAGEHEVSLNAENLATGVYILRITAGSYSEVTRLVLVR
jgi:hypothetical protein